MVCSSRKIPKPAQSQTGGLCRHDRQHQRYSASLGGDRKTSDLRIESTHRYRSECGERNGCYRKTAPARCLFASSGCCRDRGISSVRSRNRLRSRCFWVFPAPRLVQRGLLDCRSRGALAECRGGFHRDEEGSCLWQDASEYFEPAQKSGRFFCCTEVAQERKKQRERSQILRKLERGGQDETGNSDEGRQGNELLVQGKIVDTGGACIDVWK
mmetsp:Transcript_17472/g.35909  ORF Transcript_17472/g.35909 Transcript_17472/m.35909 type:complete len:213 (+) Transcript_17472:607-1245(+)